jgi:hypothetical protein
MFLGKIFYAHDIVKKTKKHKTYVDALNETLDLVKEVHIKYPYTKITSHPAEKNPDNIFYEIVEVNSDTTNEIIATVLVTVIGLMVAGMLHLL